MDPDPTDAGGLQDGLELVAEEQGDRLLVRQVRAEVGQERIADDHVQLGLDDEAPSVVEECGAGADGLGAEG